MNKNTSCHPQSDFLPSLYANDTGIVEGYVKTTYKVQLNKKQSDTEDSDKETPRGPRLSLTRRRQALWVETNSCTFVQHVIA